MDMYCYTPLDDQAYFRGEPLHIGNTVQLFVDDTLIEDSWNVVRKQPTPLRYPGNPILLPDKPWECGHIHAPCVLYDQQEDLYRMWYWAFNITGYYQPKDLEKGICCYYMLYAESRDGLSWVKPELDVVPFGKYKRNNIVFTGRGFCAYARVFIDPKETSPEKKYKMIYNDRGYGPSLAYSPDGIHWEIDEAHSPLFNFHADCHLNMLYDKSRGMWQLVMRPVMYSSGHYGPSPYQVQRQHRRRRVCMAESPDLLTWSRPREVLRTDELDGKAEFDNIDVFAYGNKIIGLASMFTPGIADAGNSQRMLTHLVFSNDFYHWNRMPIRKPLLDFGQPDAFDQGSMTITGYPIIQPSGDILLYYGGTRWEEDPHFMHGSIGMLVMRKDGFVEQFANEEGGWLLTREFVFDGNQLEVNARCMMGGNSFIQVEILEYREDVPDERGGKRIEGFTREDCDPIITNINSAVVSWRGSSDLSCLRGRRVYLRFCMMRAGIYSFTVNNV